MNQRKPPNKPVTQSEIPSSRVSRFLKIGSMASSLTGNIIKNTASAALRAQAPSAQNTLLNINNAKTITKHLAHMRGAAMKLGQMLSMDAGELLPPEWEPVLALLREQAHSMPQHQLEQVLQHNWGSNWQHHFAEFDMQAIAAASIGQVHKATLTSGEVVAVKVQYPGVSASIDSDIDNVAGLLKLARLIPKGLDINSILQQAKAQLKQEADYLSELSYLQRYHTLLMHDKRYVVPKAYAHLSTPQILCMEYITARPMAELVYDTVKTRTTIVENLFELVFNELFTFQFMQSDPNYANFMYNDTTKQLVLLDFGACRTLSDHATQGYKNMARAMQAQNKDDILSALLSLGLLNNNTPSAATQIVINACLMASECLQTPSYNVKQARIVKRLQDLTKGLVSDKNAIAAPDFDVALVNRKISGTVLLANKMDVPINLAALLAPFIQSTRN